MHFQAQAVSQEEFQAWLQKVRQSKELLDLNRYEKLAQPSAGYYPVTYFAAVEPGLFVHILRKFDPSWSEHPGSMGRSPVSTQAGTDVAEDN